MKIIGVDPGKVTGLAISINGIITELITTDFWGCIDHLNNNHDAMIVIELPRTKHVWHSATSIRAVQRTSVNVGSCIREAELIIKWLHKNKRVYIIQAPQGKINGRKFKIITDWKGRTNSHTRDAAMLIYQKNWRA